MSTMPRMRTVQQCAKYLKDNDPDGRIGEWRIRQMIACNEIPVVRAGRKYLINLDNLLNYLSGNRDIETNNENAPI